MPPTSPEFPLHLPPPGKDREAHREEERDFDPELEALPAPPKRERTWTIVVLAVTILASLAMMASLLRDAAYAFAPSQSADLGDLNRGANADPSLDAYDNCFVRATAMLGAAGALRYERAFDPDSYRVAPVAGRTDVWVEIHMKEGEESSRFIPPTSFAGRLIRFSEVGPRHRGLRDAVGSVGGTNVPADAWLIVDAEQPANARWAVMLVILFAGFAMWNAFAIAKLVRKVD
jgi:hypothetical protein